MPVSSRKAGKRDSKHVGGTGADVRTMPKPARKPKSLDDLYGGGETGNLIHPDFDNKKVYAWFQRRHLKGSTLIDADGCYRREDHEWKIPYGVRIAMKSPLVYGQMAVKYPFVVTWTSPKNGKRLKKNFTSLIAAVHFIATKAQYVDTDASVISRVVGYNIPPKLRGKFPRKMNGRHVYWCPYCMDARSYRRMHPEREFYALKKYWNSVKNYYDWKEVKLAVLQCTVCGLTNQDPKFRASNQPYETRKIKQGVRRVKKTRKRK